MTRTRLEKKLPQLCMVNPFRFDDFHWEYQFEGRELQLKLVRGKWEFPLTVAIDALEPDEEVSPRCLFEFGMACMEASTLAAERALMPTEAYLAATPEQRDEKRFLRDVSFTMYKTACRVQMI